jgi:hypothetical protein
MSRITALLLPKGTRAAALGWVVALAALAVPLPSQGMDAVAVRCLCQDGALDHGDYVSCVSHLGRRLVAKGVLDASERALLVQEAARSRVPDELQDLNCTRYIGWGTGVQADARTYAPGETARIEGLLWNFSPDYVYGEGAASAGPPANPNSCLILLTLRDTLGNVAHREEVLCVYTMEPYPLGEGQVRRLSAELELVYLRSELGIPDGTPLQPGTYLAVAESMAEYPHHSSASGGLHPLSAVPIEVEVTP